MDRTRCAKQTARFAESVRHLTDDLAPHARYSCVTSSQLCRQKEARERERGADIISSDSSYKPAVGTWGVYQRPRDISKAYGGGRTLTPADSATSEEEQAKLDAQLQQQLEAFRRSAGLVVDPETEARCQQLTGEGMPGRTSHDCSTGDCASTAAHTPTSRFPSGTPCDEVNHSRYSKVLCC